MEPSGTVLVFLALTGSYSKAEQRRAARQAAYTSFGLIVGFVLLGKYIFQFLQISIESLQLSGGFLLFLVAMELLMGMNQGTPMPRVNGAMWP